MKTNVAETLWDAQDSDSYLKVSRSMAYKLGHPGDLSCLRVGECLLLDPAVGRAFAPGALLGSLGHLSRRSA